MKNKKAEITIEEVVKMVLAVLGIIVLIVLAVGLYGIFTKKTELEQARETLKQLVEKMKLLEEGETDSFLITSPKGWGLVGNNYYYQDKLSDQCVGKDCLCICNKIFELGLWKYDCNNQGVCLEIETQSIIQNPVFEDEKKPDPIQSNHALQTFVSFEEVPKTLFIRKTEKGIFFSAEEGNSEIINDFLNKEVEFKGEKINMNDLILTNLFFECSKEWDISTLNGKMNVDSELKKFIEEESKKYLNELITTNKINGGKIVFTATYRVFTKNPILVSAGDVKSCSVLEERTMCFNEIDKNKANPHGLIAGYLRMYIC